MPRFPLPQTGSTHELCDGYAKRGVAVQYGKADLDFGKPSVEVLCHAWLAKRFDAMHLRFGVGTADSDGVVAFACVVGPICRDAPDFL